jgi:lysophospholipase L1-like esterase
MHPYNEQGFKTDILMEVPKPDNVYRIIAYGDSNTDGPVSMDWSNELQKLLEPRSNARRRYEVINAGVAGYSSYQGLQRFLQEVDKYEPDLVFVSFGWNDLAHALDKPDKHYQPRSKALVALLRVLIKYRTYQAIQHHVQAPKLAQQAKQEIQPRVSLEDYLDNMRAFAETGREKGVEVVFLSRPYRAPTEQLLKNPGWRSRVPLYNQALEEFTREEGAYFFDVQQHYELNTEGLFSDESHFYTEEGMAEMGRYLLRELESHKLL